MEDARRIHRSRKNDMAGKRRPEPGAGVIRQVAHEGHKPIAGRASAL